MIKKNTLDIESLFTALQNTSCDYAKPKRFSIKQIDRILEATKNLNFVLVKFQTGNKVAKMSFGTNNKINFRKVHYDKKNAPEIDFETLKNINGSG